MSAAPLSAPPPTWTARNQVSDWLTPRRNVPGIRDRLNRLLDACALRLYDLERRLLTDRGGYASLRG